MKRNKIKRSFFYILRGNEDFVEKLEMFDIEYSKLGKQIKKEVL